MEWIKVVRLITHLIITCCLVIAINIVYLIITLIKLYIQYYRRQLTKSN